MKSTLLNDKALEFIAQKELTGALPSGAGIAVSILKDEKVLLNGTYGLRERDRDLPVTQDTLFEISSLTKAFTSTALLMASEEGKIDLNRPINASKELLVFSDPEISRNISINDILSHQTGIPAYDLLWYFNSFKSRELVEVVAHLDVPPNSFRQSFSYNNLMYGVLGNLFDELVGESWESYVTRKILIPLEMTSTSCQSLPHNPHEQNLALPYVGTQRVKKVDMSAIAAAGNLRSNLKDMARWMAFLLNEGKTTHGEQLLSQPSIKLMHSKQISAENANPLFFQGLEWLGPIGVDYGLGWFIGSTKGLKTLYHPALIDGFSGSLVLIPEIRIGFFVMTNLNLSGFSGLLIQDLLESLLANKSTGLAYETTPVTPSIIGKYVNPAFGKIAIDRSGKYLVLDYNGNKWPLTWKSESTAEFVMTAFGLQIPMSVQFETNSLSIPLSLDSRLGAQVFTRSC